MKRMIGGTKAEPGFYWNPADWQIVTIEKEPRALPGGRDQKFVKVPAAGMLVLTPLLGLSFVVFLPFVGFALVARQLGRKAFQAAGILRARLWAEDVRKAQPAAPARRKQA
jgi:hypothetical protein